MFNVYKLGHVALHWN